MLTTTPQISVIIPIYNDALYIQEAITIWIYRGSDWIDTSTGEMLTGYVPTVKEYEYSRRIKLFT